MDYFESKLLQNIKRRLFDELTDTLQQHSGYRDKVKAYHKFPYKERPMMGVVIKNVSASRQRLSSDDYATTMLSHVALANAETKEGRILKWVWEDEVHLTGYQKNEDVSSQLSGDTSFGTNRVFRLSRKSIVAGPFNTKIADNFAQVDVTVNGNRVFPEFIDGKKGIVILEQAPALGSTVLISYYYNNLTPPGRYYMEVVSKTQYVIDPLYVVKDEEVIIKTTGTETTAQLENHDLLPGFDVLYTKRYAYSNKTFLANGVDYTVNATGLITFINHLPVGVTLYANYRWIGQELGPFDFPTEDYQYVNNVLPGVVLAFSSEKIIGDKNIIIVYPTREVSSKVYSGHWNMSVEIDVFVRDTQQLPELTDHIINDMWSRKRLALINEGITMESIDSAGESEEVYDENTGDMYYHNSVPMTLITEWKRFVPYLTEIMDFTMDINLRQPTKEYVVTKDGRILETKLVPYNKPYEVKYPEPGYVGYS